MARPGKAWEPPDSEIIRAVTLPRDGAPWPPPGWADAWAAVDAWDAWWTGDLARIDSATRTRYQPRIRPSQLDGGVVGATSRTLFGRPRVDAATRDVHVPLAGDIAAAAASLVAHDEATAAEDRDNGQPVEMPAVDLGSAAESAAALGGVWFRAVSDPDTSETPFVDFAHADQCYGGWSWGRLRWACFVSILVAHGNRVVRHLEHHEVEDTPLGLVSVIRHQVMDGTHRDLGRTVPLTDHGVDIPDLVELPDGGQGIITPSPILTASYASNRGPSPLWRRKPSITQLGAPDIAGNEHLLRGADQAWTALMRELSLSRARVLVPESMARDLGPGQGAAWDSEAEALLLPLTSLITQEATMASTIQHVQPQLRAAEHLAVVEALALATVRSAGLDPDSLGMRSGGGAVTATEIAARESTSLRLRRKKAQQLEPALSRVATAARWLGGLGEASPVRVSLPPPAPAPLVVRAETVELLSRARAASTRSLVQVLHPEWTPDRVDVEVDAVRAEQGVPAGDDSP